MSRRRVRRWLERVDQEMPALLAFAASRCARSGLPAHCAEDVVAEAIAGVVQGTSDGRGGRRPRRQDLRTRGAWRNYLRGAINSRVEAWGRRRRPDARGGFRAEPVRGDGSGAAGRTESPDGEIQIRDLQAVLFERLRRVAPARLHSTIDRWESVFAWSDSIPRVDSHKHVRAVRQLARRILGQLGWDPRG